MIIEGLTSSFLREIWGGDHDVDSDQLMLALFDSSANLGPDTASYTSTGEIAGTGYVAGGQVLTGAAIALDGPTAALRFNPAVWPGASFTARGGLIYNASKGNKTIAVLDFGSDKIAVPERPFTVSFF